MGAVLRQLALRNAQERYLGHLQCNTDEGKVRTTVNRWQL